MTADERHRLAELYGQEYMGKIFYYCLRKTGDSLDAEDLTSDITLQVLTALHEGVDVVSFPAWVWQIARNRYALWAKTRRRRGEQDSLIDVDDPAAEGILTANGRNTTPSVADEYAHAEEMAILRRELAFLGRDYREVVVAFYIEDRSVKDIAAALGEPEGTVKSRLFRSRNLLKEGMKMAREFGPKSYKPEKVRFVGSGNQSSGLPWSAVQRVLPKNILLEASNNPSTAEELSVAVGVAMPYMEEEIAALESAGLLKKVGNRYITNFFIESRSLQTEIYNELTLLTRDWADRYARVATDAVTIYREGCFIPAGMTDDELKWLIVLDLHDQCIFRCDGYTCDFPVKHTHPQDTWGFVGFEGGTQPGEWFIGHSGAMADTRTDFWSYQIGKWNMWNRAAVWNGEATQLLGELIRTGRSVSTLSDVEKRLWDKVNGRIVHADGDGKVIPDVVTFRGDELATVHAKVKEHPEYPALQAGMQAVFDRVVEILRRESHAVLEDQLPYCASMRLCDTRHLLIDALVDKGVLPIPTEPDKSTVAMQLIVR